MTIDGRREEVIVYIQERFGGHRESVRIWVLENIIPSFGCTAEELLQEDRYEDLMRYLKRLEDGGYA